MKRLLTVVLAIVLSSALAIAQEKAAIISNVAATCGCTVPSWPKEPVAPGKTAEIKVSFNSAGKMGKQNSVVRIYSNATEPIEKVSLISNVLPK